MKKIKLTKLVLLSLIAGFTFVSCGDDDDGGNEPAVVKTRTQLLTEKNLRVTSDVYTYNNISVDEFQDPTSYEECDKDDFIKFNADNSGIFDEGATKCDTSDPQNYPFTWAFTENETKILLTSFGFGQEAKIVKLDDNTLIIEITDVYDYDGDGNDETVVQTITHAKF